jgi:drug/metabolite transporter (DMT)-like permease
VPLALGSAALFGAAAPLSKLLLENVSPFMLAGLLYLGAGLGLAIYKLLRARNADSTEAKLNRADIPWLALAIAMGGVIAPVVLLLGLMKSTASSSALLLNLEGLATLLIAWLVYRENVDRRLFVGAMAILAGAVVLSWDGQGFAFDAGALFVAGACLAWGLDNNFTRKISAADPVMIAMLKGLIAGAVNIALAFYLGAQLPNLPFIIGAGAVGFLAIGVSLVMFILALRHIGTARTGAYYSLAPFIGAVLAFGLLGEPVTLKLLLAGGLMAIGLWLHLTERHEHDHTHEAMTHDHAHTHDEHHQHSHTEDVAEPHAHPHQHAVLRHKHPHYPDLHHRHGHH